MFKKDTIMKKTYMTPETQVVKVEIQHLLNDASRPRIAGTTQDVNDLLGRGDAGWNDDDWDD